MNTSTIAARRFLGTWFTALCACAAAGCASMPVALAPSSSPAAPGVLGTIPTRGVNCQFFFLGLIPMTHSIDTQAALDEAKKRADVDVLTDVTVDFIASYYIIVSDNCVRVQGKGVPRATGGATPPTLSGPSPTPVSADEILKATHGTPPTKKPEP